MRVLVVHSDVPADAPPDDQDTILTAQAIAETLIGAGHEASLMPFAVSPDAIGAALETSRCDLVFNMVESVLGQDSLAATAPAIFEQFAIAYTGSAAAPIMLAGDKPLAKSVMRAAGLPTPDWTSPPSWQGLRDGMRYVVKSATEDASLALDDQSVVDTRAAVMSRAEFCTQRFGGRWFAEAYIDGREFNVALIKEHAGWLVLPLPEMFFEEWPAEKPRIVGYRAKWETGSVECATTTRRFGLERETPALAASLGDLARRACDLLGLSGYARVDFRVDTAGAATILEVNPNPCLAPDAGFAAAAAEQGWSYEALIARIAEGARKR